jgi:hypothetical protein
MLSIGITSKPSFLKIEMIQKLKGGFYRHGHTHTPYTQTAWGYNLATFPLQESKRG